MAPSLLFEILSDEYGGGIVMTNVYFNFGQEQ